MVLSTYFNQYSPLSKKSSEALDSLSMDVSYPRGYLIHRAGQVSHTVYLMKKGIARTFYYRNGNDITNYFFSEGEGVAAMESLYSKKPSFYNIELLEDCELIKVDYHNLETLYKKYHDLESCGRQLTIQCYLEENERSRSFQMLTAKKRYLNLIKSKPEILQRVKLGHIASFIGVTQVQLSRIRASITSVNGKASMDETIFESKDFGKKYSPNK